MAEVQRHRVLELIGDRKYHSAFLTSYSFDFAFFETTVMRQLKSNHLVNINVLVDNDQLNGSLGFTTGSAKGISRGYSISGIESSAVFHPKIYLFIGNKEGAIIIGSGNITPSGFGRNAEIWGAFHIDGSDDPKAALFLQAWKYVKSAINKIPGFTSQRLLFAEFNAPWIKEIEESADYADINDTDKIALIYNEENISIGSKLADFIEEDVERITIVSPFYDKNLELVSRIQKQFTPDEIRLVMPSSGELIPASIPANLKALVSLSKWEDVFKSDTRRLHAKLIYLEGKKNINYLIFGSTNATIPAFGYEKNYNEEISLILRQDGGSILTDLGFLTKFPKSKLSDFERIEQKHESAELSKRYVFPIQLISIDQEGRNLFVYLNTNQKYNKLSLKIFGSLGEESKEYQMIKKKDFYEVDISDKPGYNHLYAQIFYEGNPASNKQVIQDIYELAKANPSPELGQLEEHFQLINAGQEDLSVLLDFLVYDKEEDEIPVFGKRSDSKGNEDLKETKKEKESKVLKYEDLIQEDQERFNLKYRYLHNSTARILDFLLNYLFKSVISDIESQLEDEEESEDVNKSTGRSDFLIGNTISTLQLEENEFHRIALKIKKHLSGYRDRLREMAIESGCPEGKCPLTLKEYSRFIIATQFLLLYGGKHQGVKKVTHKFKSENESFDEIEVTYRPFIPFSGEFGDFNFKTLSIDIIGDFLWLLIKFDKSIISDPIRFEEYKIHALINSLLCISLIPWNEDYERHKNLKEILFLNIIEYIGEADYSNVFKKEELWVKLKTLNQKTGRKDEASVERIKELFERFHIRYLKFKNELGKEVASRNNIVDVNTLNIYDIVFRNQYGYCGIYRLKDSRIPEGGTILFRPGLHDPYNDDPMLSTPLPQSKLIRF